MLSIGVPLDAMRLMLLPLPLLERGNKHPKAKPKPTEPANIGQRPLTEALQGKRMKLAEEFPVWFAHVTRH